MNWHTHQQHKEGHENMENNNKKKEGAYAQLTGFHRAVPIILIALAVFIAVCFFTQNHTGQFGIVIAGTLRGLFSLGGYFIPVLFVVHALFYPSDIQRKRLIPRIIFTALLLIFISCFAHAISTWGAEPSFDAALVYENGKMNVGGGVIGAAFAFLIISVIGHVGLVLLALTVFAIYIAYFLAGEDNPAKNFIRKVAFKVLSFFAGIEKRIKASKEKKNNKKAEKEVDKKIDHQIKDDEKRRAEERRNSKKINALNEKESELYEDDFFAVDNGLKEFKIEALNIEEAKAEADLELNPTLQDKVHHKSEVPEKENKESARAKRTIDTDYGIGADEVSYTVENNGKDIVMDKPSEAPTATKFSYGLDDSAENVFTSDFVAMNFEENEKIAAKQSTMGPAVSNTANAPRSNAAYSTPDRMFSDEDVAAARRRVDFELRKAELKKQRELEEEERRRAAEFTPTTVEFDINPEKAPKEPAVEVAKEEPVPVYEAPRAYEPTPAPTYEEPKAYEPTPAPTYEEPKAYEPAPAPVYEEPIAAVEEETVAEPVSVVIEDKTEPDVATAEGEISFSFDDEDEEDDFGPVFTGEIDKPVVDDGEVSFDFAEDEDDDIPSFTQEITEEEENDEPMRVIPPEERNPQVDEYRKMFTVFDDEDDNTDDGEKPTYTAATDYAAEDDEDDEITVTATDKRPLFSYGDELNDDEPSVPTRTEADEDEPPFDFEPARAKEEKPEPPKPEKPDYSNFKFPPIDILKKGFEEEDPTIEEEIAENGDKLIDSLAQFDVRASIKSVDRGPRITRYEIVPARGVRVSRVISLFDDIALNLAAEGIRMEAPIPGKSAIGVEIPNKHPSTVFLRDLLESDEFMNEPSKTFACFGKDVTGNPIFGDIAKMPHILIAGATGMGKSVCINSILISILYKARPDEVKFIMVDPKTVEFTMYNGIPHLLVPVVTDAKQAAGALMWAIDEMNRRYELMAKHEVRKLDSYNELVKENPEIGEPLPKIIIVIDELNDLMQQVRKPVEGLITNITQKARAAGIHMIIGTQRPSVDVITGVIKANVPSRVSCKVTSLTDSRTILDQAGAEKLLDKGDMLFAPVGKPKPLRVQGAFVSDGEVEKIMKYLKSNVSGAIYDEKALEDMTRAAAKCSKGKDSDDDGDNERGGEEGAGYLNDKQFLEAVDLAIKQGKISTSLIQRKISVGYGKAAKFIDIMEDLGVVSEPNGSKPRDVLVTKNEWAEMISRRSLDD